MPNAALTRAAVEKLFQKSHHPFGFINVVEKYSALDLAKTFLCVTTLACLQAVRIFGNCARVIEDAFNVASLRSPCMQSTWSMQMSKVFVFLKNESGATAIEYGLIAAGISVVIISAVQAVGSNLNTTFSSIGSALSKP